MKLCFGSFFCVLCEAKAPQVNNQTLLTQLLMPISKKSDNFDDSFASSLKIGRSNLPSHIIDNCRNIKIDVLIKNIDDNVLKIIKKTYHKAVVLAIKEIIIDDTTIDKSVMIGVSNNFKKSDIISSSNINLPVFLANILHYVVTEVDNNLKKEDKSISINKYYLDSMRHLYDTINFTDEVISQTTPLSTTVKDNLFNDTFFEVKSIDDLYSDNYSFLKFYHLDIYNNKFSYLKLTEFLYDNVDKYIFSRKKINDYYDNNRVERLAHDALSKLDNSTDSFSDIMIYSFLESVLKAPKIMSSYEINSNTNNISKTSGIHLFVNEQLKINQLIFNSAKTTNNIHSAINSVLEQIHSIMDNLDNEYRLIDRTIFNKEFDPNTTEYLKQLIIPSKGKVYRPESAFGIFIGYSIDIPNKNLFNNEKYSESIKSDMQNEISNLIPKIKEELNEFIMQGYSFYFFFLPLNDADNDKIKIINGI